MSGWPEGTSSGSAAAIQPSGDTTGVTDTAAIQAALNATGIALLAPTLTVNFYVTNITMPAYSKIVGAGHNMTNIAGVAGATGAMILIPSGVTNPGIVLRGFYLYQHAGNYSYGIQFATVGSIVFDTPILDDVWVNGFTGIGLYYGGNRGGLACHDVNAGSCTGGGVSIGGSDVVFDTLTVGFNGAYGLSISGSMIHVRDLDCFNNTTVGVIIHISQVFIDRATFDQNGGPGLIVDSGATQVFIGGRFTANGLTTTNTYPHANISAAAALGVTFLPTCWFNAVEFGHAQVTTYDIYTNGVTYYDYSQYAGTSSTSGHTDLANFNQPLLQQLGAIQELGYNAVTSPAANATTTPSSTGMPTVTCKTPATAVEVELWCGAVYCTTGGNGYLSIQVDGSYVQAGSYNPGTGVAGDTGTVCIKARVVLTAGSHTFTGFLTAGAGTITASCGAGPAGLTAGPMFIRVVG